MEPVPRRARLKEAHYRQRTVSHDNGSSDFAGSVFGFFRAKLLRGLLADCRHQQLLHQTGAVASRGKGHAKLLIVRTIDQRFLRGKLP